MATSWLTLAVLHLISVARLTTGVCDIPGAGDPITLTEWTGVLASPGLDKGIYPNLQDCTWNLQVSAGSRIRLTFDVFDLEQPNGLSGVGRTKTDCPDYLKVIDSSGQTLFDDCGTVSSTPLVTSSGDRMTIVFHSDESGTSRGFKVTYTGLCESDVTDIGQVLTIPSQFSQPVPGVTCSWVIGQTGRGKVSLLKTSDHLMTDDRKLNLMLPVCGQSPLKIIYENSTDLEMVEFCEGEAIQAYTGNITLVYNVSAPETKKWLGNISIEFTEDLNCSQLCPLNSGCKTVQDFPRVRFTCLCLDGAQDILGCGSNQKISITEKSPEDRTAFCLQEKDQRPGGGITWATTPVNQTDVRPCPAGTLGEATRLCLLDPQSDGRGLWIRPNLTGCFSSEVQQILREVSVLLETAAMYGVDYESLLNVTRRLAAVTDRIWNSPSGLLFLTSGDLVAIVDILEMMVGVENVTGSLDDLDMFIEKYIQIVDNILDVKAVDIWMNSQAHVVEAKVTKVIELMQRQLTSYLNQSETLATNGTFHSNTRDVRIVDYDTNPPVLFQKYTRNLDISVYRYRLGSSVLLIGDDLSTSSSLQIPALVFNGSDQTGVVDQSRLYVAKFRSVARLLSLQENSSERNVQNEFNIVNSDVLSVEFLDLPSSFVNHLQQPVVLKFLYKDTKWTKTHKEKCAFINHSANSYRDRWSSQGCHVADSNQSHVTCHCYHLTNFAVLMDIYGSQELIDPENQLLLTYVSYIGGGLSILTCTITIVVFKFFRLSSDRILIHQHLSVSIICVQLLFMCLINTSKENGASLIGCRIVAILLHYCLTAMFCWMLVQGAHLYVVLVQVFPLGSQAKKYLAVGWGLPLVIVGVSAGVFHDKYGAGRLCWLDKELLVACLVPTVGLVLLVNFVILVVVIRLMVRSNKCTQKYRQQERSNIKTSIKATVVLLPLLGLTWIFGFLSINTGGGPQVLSYLFTYLFTISNSFQGVLFFVFHCLLNVDVRQAYERRFNRKIKTSFGDTTSSRLQRLSEADVSKGNRLSFLYGKHLNIPFSYVNDLCKQMSRVGYSKETTNASSPVIDLT